MNEPNQNPHPAFKEIAAKKIEAQDSKISKLETKMDAVAHNTASLEKLLDRIDKLKDVIERNIFSAEKLAAIGKSLDNCIAELRQPRQYTIRHEHHFPKIAWATAVLFL